MGMCGLSKYTDMRITHNITGERGEEEIPRHPRSWGLLLIEIVSLNLALESWADKLST